jgi:hypothetical protein
MIVSTTAHSPHLIGSALAGPPTFIYAALHNKSRVFFASQKHGARIAGLTI